MPQPLQMYPWTELWHPEVLAWLGLLQVAYLLAVGPWRTAFRWGSPVPAWRQLLFSSALALVYLAEGTPMHVLAENFLFSAHMAQHVLLTLVMPPLMLLALPDWMIRPLLRPRPVAAVFRGLTKPVVALLLFNLIYSIWHLPVAYQSPLLFHWFHMVQHGVLVFTAFLMWWPIASQVAEFPPISPGLSMLYIFASAVSQIAVHAMVTFAEHVIYHFYAQAPRLWGIDAIADQQIAGMIMNLGGMAVFVTTWAVVFFRWVGREESKKSVQV